MKNICLNLFIFILINIQVVAQTGPLPGDVYREYSVSLKVRNNWRVTDPSVTRIDALTFLPNPVLSVTIDDLQGATRSEVLMDIWGGHAGTSNKRFRFNENNWMKIPEIPTIAIDPECYMSQYNVIMDMPLEYLKEGKNTFEGTSGKQICNSFNWGQWGWYVMIVRVYYSSDKLHTAGSIKYPVSGAFIRDNPELAVSVENAENVSEVQFLGKYVGYDERGLGYYDDWHLAYHGVNIEGNIGNAIAAPFKVFWNTEWIPDQAPKSVQFLARIKDKNGMWYVTNTVNTITLDRKGSPSIKMFTATDIPKPFTVRKLGDGSPRTRGCTVLISELEDATDARLFHRTWNAADDDAARGTVLLPLEVNGNGFKTFGKNHDYSLSSIQIPLNNLVTGKNSVTYKSNTSHHGIEVLWPGPAIMVKYDKKSKSGVKHKH